MENLIESLKILDYEKTFCLQKGFSAIDRTMFIMPGTTQQQFPFFSGLVSWALTLAKVAFVDWEFDDPTTASNNILLELNKLGFSVADGQAGKLRLGYGGAVLAALEFVVQYAIRTLDVRTEKPVYTAVAQAETTTGDGVDIDKDLEDAFSDDDLNLDNDDIDVDDDDDELMYDDICKTNGSEAAASGHESFEGQRGTGTSYKCTGRML